MGRLLMKLCCNSLFGPKESPTCMLNGILKDTYILYDNFCETLVQMGREHVENGGGIWGEEEKGRELGEEEEGVVVEELAFFGSPLLLKVLKSEGESVSGILLSLDLLSCLRSELLKKEK